MPTGPTRSPDLCDEAPVGDMGRKPSALTLRAPPATLGTGGVSGSVRPEADPWTFNIFS